MLLIPSSFPFSELSEMLASENNAFFAMNENPAWFSRVRNIHEYTYLMQRDCARSNSNLSKSRLKPSKVSVTSAGREFVFRCSTFSRLVRVKGVCIDNQLEYYLVKLVMPWKPEKSTKWIAEQMFFFNEFSRLTNIQHYFDWLTKLVKQASFVSCLQCINCIRQDQITLNGLSSQMAHLRYLTVLISSGVVDNEKELAML
jgi:hypothetical protein